MSNIDAVCIYLTRDGLCHLPPDGGPCCYNAALDAVLKAGVPHREKLLALRKEVSP